MSDPSSRRTRVVTFYSSKGGQGCTTVALLTALLLGRTHPVDITGHYPDDIAAAAGRPLRFEHGAIALTQTLQLLTYRRASRAPLVVHDAGRLLNGPEPDTSDTHRYLVLRPCYLALRAAQAHRIRPRGVIFVEEPGRAITLDDVTEILGVPIVATVPHTPDLARRIDAGLLIDRPAQLLQERLERVVADVYTRDLARRTSPSRTIDGPYIGRHR